jgi:hypothetical protein
MAGEKFVANDAIRDAVKGRESEILDKLGIDWRSGKPHITCPYPTHSDNDPSWRWDERHARAYCTCIEKSHGIFDIVMVMLGIIFVAAKIHVAQLLGRSDLIRTKSSSGQRTDAASLLNPAAANRDDSLVALYLAARLGLTAPNAVPVPTTKTVGWKSLAYFDPPTKKGGQPKLVGSTPCAVFETIAADGRQHAHRIYLAPSGDGKADLGIDERGKQRDPKKSARVAEGQPSTAGCCVVWGNPEVAHVGLAEGIENAAAVAYAFKDEIAAGQLAVLSPITAGGIEAFAPWPNNRTVTIAADRDEAKSGAGFKRGEKAARNLALRLAMDAKEGGRQFQTLIALPGAPGTKYDFLDLFRAEGPYGLRAAILAAAPIVQTTEETELERINSLYPLPALFDMRLEYRHTDKKGIWLHKCVGQDGETGEAIWAPISSPFGAIVRLMKPGTQAAFGLRVHVDAPNGGTNTVDFLCGELFRLAASTIRSALADGGLRVANGGETDIIAICKQAAPTDCIVIASASGWHPKSDFLDFGGAQC